MKQQGETTSTVERIRGLQTDIQDLRSKNDSLKAEIEAQQAAHKAQIAAAENRAHESWLAARQTQRRFEESAAEAGALRRKLTSLSAASADGSCEYKYAGHLGSRHMFTDRYRSLAVHTPLEGADGGPSPIHHDPAAAAINPGASAHLMGVLPPPPFHPHAPFMGPPPPLLPPLGYMPQPPPPLLPPYGGLVGVLPPPPLLPPPGEMRPPPLGRLMSPPPLGVGGPGSAGGRYSPMDARGHLDHRYHRGGGGGAGVGGGGNGRYSPDDDYAYDSDDDRHFDDRQNDDHHHRYRSRTPDYDETDFSPPPSPEPHRGYQSRDGGGGSVRQHHNPATSRSHNNNGGGNSGGVGTGSNRSHLYSPPMSTKSDTTSRSKGSRPSSRTGGRHATMPSASRANARPCDSSDSMSADEYRSDAPPNAHEDGGNSAGGAARYRAATHHRPRLPSRAAYCGRDDSTSSS